MLAVGLPLASRAPLASVKNEMRLLCVSDLWLAVPLAYTEAVAGEAKTREG